MKLNLVIAASLAVLAGCSQQPTPADQTTATPAPEATAPSTAPSTAPAAATPNFPAGYQLDQPIPAADIKTSLAVVGPPVYQAQGDSLEFDVEVTNDGKSPLTSFGKDPVQLGVTLAGPDGIDKVPGNRDFKRVRLPLIAPGAKMQVHVVLPAKPLLGLKVQLDLVQEGVAWFGKEYKQAIVDVGTFQRCAGGGNTLCDASGSPVGTH